MLSLSLILTACSGRPESLPETWWHDAIGGKIAEQRPPPPGNDDPFPGLNTVPAKPARPDTTAMNRTTAGLITDRIDANHAAAMAPILPLTAPKSPAAPAAGAEGASASLPAAAQKPQTAPTQAGTAPRPAGGPLPPLPTQEPARPGIAPAPPPPLPVATAPPPESPKPPDGTPVEFAARSAALNADALEQLTTLAAGRGDHGIAITGHGDAATAIPSAQADALTLALARAHAVATQLTAQGVPNAAMRINAEAAGRGAFIRLLP